jgi:hypothetical protein
MSEATIIKKNRITKFQEGGTFNFGDAKKAIESSNLSPRMKKKRLTEIGDIEHSFSNGDLGKIEVDRENKVWRWSDAKDGLGKKRGVTEGEKKLLGGKGTLGLQGTKYDRMLDWMVSANYIKPSESSDGAEPKVDASLADQIKIESDLNNNNEEITPVLEVAETEEEKAARLAQEERVRLAQEEAAKQAKAKQERDKVNSGLDEALGGSDLLPGVTEDKNSPKNQPGVSPANDSAAIQNLSVSNDGWVGERLDPDYQNAKSWDQIYGTKIPFTHPIYGNVPAKLAEWTLDGTLGRGRSTIDEWKRAFGADTPKPKELILEEKARKASAEFSKFAKENDLPRDRASAERFIKENPQHSGYIQLTSTKNNPTVVYQGTINNTMETGTVADYLLGGTGVVAAAPSIPKIAVSSVRAAGKGLKKAAKSVGATAKSAPGTLKNTAKQITESVKNTGKSGENLSNAGSIEKIAKNVIKNAKYPSQASREVSKLGYPKVTSDQIKSKIADIVAKGKETAKLNTGTASVIIKQAGGSKEKAIKAVNKLPKSIRGSIKEKVNKHFASKNKSSKKPSLSKGGNIPHVPVLKMQAGKTVPSYEEWINDNEYYNADNKFPTRSNSFEDTPNLAESKNKIDFSNFGKGISLNPLIKYAVTKPVEVKAAKIPLMRFTPGNVDVKRGLSSDERALAEKSFNSNMKSISPRSANPDAEVINSMVQSRAATKFGETLASYDIQQRERSEAIQRQQEERNREMEGTVDNINRETTYKNNLAKAEGELKNKQLKAKRTADLVIGLANEATKMDASEAQLGTVRSQQAYSTALKAAELDYVAKSNKVNPGLLKAKQNELDTLNASIEVEVDEAKRQEKESKKEQLNKEIASLEAAVKARDAALQAIQELPVTFGEGDMDRFSEANRSGTLGSVLDLFRRKKTTP